MKDHSKTRGVDRAASDLDVKKAYRRLAKLYPPDKVQGDEAKKEEAEKKFQEVADSPLDSEFRQGRGGGDERRE